jgi:hypothetical protein
MERFFPQEDAHQVDVLLALLLLLLAGHVSPGGPQDQAYCRPCPEGQIPNAEHSVCGKLLQQLAEDGR